jgi:transitional endoplasmic reticulum ATPase
MIPAMRDKLKGVARRMKHIEEIEKMGGTVPSGLLFYGPPGTGKTVTARALAKESGWGFLSASGADLMSSPTKIDEILADASDIRPCIVFLDEADDILGDRRYNGNVSAITNKLLAAMDGSGGKVPDVVFVAATNHPESMDSAAMRGGRFTEKIEFAPPTLDVVADYVNRWMGGIKATMDPTLSATSIAQRVEGESIANIKEVLQTAINVAIGRCELGKDEPVIGMADIDDACAMVLGIEG